MPYGSRLYNRCVLPMSRNARVTHILKPYPYLASRIVYLVSRPRFSFARHLQSPSWLGSLLVAVLDGEVAVP